jgi:hypothetical protein
MCIFILKYMLIFIKNRPVIRLACIKVLADADDNAVIKLTHRRRFTMQCIPAENFS